MKILIHFAGLSSVPVNAFEDTINAVRKVVASVERTELARIRTQVPEVPSKALSDALKAFDAYGKTPQCFRIGAVQPGSVELAIVLTAFGYWLLDRTLGETVEEAWKETDLRKKVRRFFLSGKSGKLQAIEREINKPNYPRMAAARRKREVVSVEIPMFARLDKHREAISIRVMSEESESVQISGPPTWEEIEVQE